MPYNTRRKSLCLTDLGVHVPSSRSTSARSPPSDGHPVAKKLKRTHSISTPTSPPRTTTLRFQEHPPHVATTSSRVVDTPPPSPGSLRNAPTIDTQGIDDVIVVGVIEQLQKSGNRPHLLKELAALLSPIVPIVESSANPAAIISSRLANYLKRNWTALSRCPLDKKLVGTHPKRIYYFLSTCPHQPIPDDANPIAARIITPSLSSAASEEDVDSHSRDVRSPSPELDLSDYNDGGHPFASHALPTAAHNIAHNRRAQSPPLEKDEREFTQTASVLQQRRKSQAAERERSGSVTMVDVGSQPAADVAMDDIPEVDETEESAMRKNSETAAALFGQMDQVAKFQPVMHSSSPFLKPSVVEMPPPMFKPSHVTIKSDDWTWFELPSPEQIELDELDNMFDDF